MATETYFSPRLNTTELPQTVGDKGGLGSVHIELLAIAKTWIKCPFLAVSTNANRSTIAKGLFSANRPLGNNQ